MEEGKPTSDVVLLCEISLLVSVCRIWHSWQTVVGHVGFGSLVASGLTNVC